MFGGKRAASVRGKIAKMRSPHDEMGTRLHDLIIKTAPELEPVWRWGLAFYRKEGRDVCYVKSSEAGMVFGVGEDPARARQGKETLVPVAWAFTSLDAAAEAAMAQSVRKAAG
jgi:hypothetical protein